MNWPIVPLCKKQLLDINLNDILENGLYRLCNTYKGGGGYDKFPVIYEKRYGINPGGNQFVVQLYGCPLKCSYCYVTINGIWGDPIYVTTENY